MARFTPDERANTPRKANEAMLKSTTDDTGSALYTFMSRFDEVAHNAEIRSAAMNGSCARFRESDGPVAIIRNTLEKPRIVANSCLPVILCLKTRGERRATNITQLLNTMAATLGFVPSVPMPRNICDIASLRRPVISNLSEYDCMLFTTASPHSEVAPEEIEFINNVVGLSVGEYALVGIGNSNVVEDAFDYVAGEAEKKSSERTV